MQQRDLRKRQRELKLWEQQYGSQLPPRDRLRLMRMTGEWPRTQQPKAMEQESHSERMDHSEQIDQDEEHQGFTDSLDEHDVRIIEKNPSHSEVVKRDIDQGAKALEIDG